MTHLVHLDDFRPPRGPEDARSALMDIAVHPPHDHTANEAGYWADWILAEMWARGFEVVAVE